LNSNIKIKRKTINLIINYEFIKSLKYTFKAVDGLPIDVFDLDFLERTIFSALDASTYTHIYDFYYIHFIKVNNYDLFITLFSVVEMF